MKKNFMAIASLLIAAMLLVVSCAPEANVEGKVEDELVEAVIGLGRSAKDITITDEYANTHIAYYYTMEAAWKSTDSKAPIYGAKTDEFLATSDSFSGTVSDKSLGLVTPGLWNIVVQGYTTTESGEKGKLVLQGKASAYFNSSSSEATVFVAPVSTDETVSVEITLKMQDLEGTETPNLNKVKYSFTNLNGGVAKEGTMTPNPAPETPLANIKEYKTTVAVRSGFNTVTFSLPEYEVKKEDGTTEVSKGGITKTFLAIPGVTVKIEGSVTPAEFVEGNANITVLDIEDGSIAIKTEGTTVDQTTEDGASIYALTKGTSYTFTYSNSASDSNKQAFKSATDGADAGTLERTYTWYVGATEFTSVNNSVCTHNFSDYVPGYYNITCIETVTFKIEGQDYKLRTSATLANVRVLDAPPQNESTPKTEESGSNPENQ